MIEIDMDKKDYDSSIDYIINGNNVVKLNHASKKRVVREVAKWICILNAIFLGMALVLSVGTSLVQDSMDFFRETMSMALMISASFSFPSILYIIPGWKIISINGKAIEGINVDEYRIVKKYTPENLVLLHTALDEKELYPKETHNTINKAIDAIIQNAQIEKEETIRLEKEKEQLAKEILKKNTTDADMTIIDSWDKVSREIVQSNSNSVNSV